MPATFDYTFDNDAYKGKTSFSTGLFIGGEVRPFAPSLPRPPERLTREEAGGTS